MTLIVWLFLRTQWLGPSLHLGLGCTIFCLYCDSSIWTMDPTQIVLLQHELAISFSQSRNIRAGSALHLSLIPWSSEVFIRIISIAVAICSYGNVHIYARDGVLPFAKCLCIVIARMPATKYDYLLHKCLGIRSEATGFPGLRYEKINPCAYHSLG